MRRPGSKRWRSSAVAAFGLGLAALGAVAQGCDDEADTTSTSSGSTSGMGGDTSSSGTPTSTSGGMNSSTSGNMTSSSTGGAFMYACGTPAPGTSTHSSAIAISPDDKRIVTANHDTGTVTILSVDYASGAPVMTVVDEIAVGADATSEPSSVTIDGCGKTAWVTLRKDQEVVEITDIDTATPKLSGRSIATGSEPTGIVAKDDNSQLYVANWVEGTISVIDTAGMALVAAPSVDLNAALASSGMIGTVSPRPSLAHPRALALNWMTDTLYVTEWFGQRTAAETAGTAANSDTNKQGLVYEVPTGGGNVGIIALPPVTDTTFNDHNNGVTGCFPNQVGAINIDGAFAYVTSTCASPRGPIQVFTGAPAGGCTMNSQCGANGGVCNAGTCAPNPANVRTTTHPALSIIDLGTKTASTTNLDRTALLTIPATAPPLSNRKSPLLPTDIIFVNGFGYVSSYGTDSVVRVTFTGGNTVSKIGSMSNNFITLRKDAADKQFRLPAGLVPAHTAGAFAFVLNEGSRDVTALAFNTQSIAGTAPNQSITSVAALPAAGSPAEAAHRGKIFFNTGLGRWSLGGEGWGSCAACHIDGLTDNVTWYFPRGPRQSVSLDGSFASNDPNDQRIFNWTAIFDEVADFEGNTRGVSGGVGALVTTAAGNACTVATQVTDCPNSQVCIPASLTCAISNLDRINTANEVPPQQALQGSSEEIANPTGSSPHPHTVLKDWQEIKAWIQTIRSPRKPVGLVAADVAAGKDIFQNVAKGNCVGCHSGPKWTVSKRFYTPDDTNNPAPAVTMTGLPSISWNANLNGFPSALFPVSMANIGSARMRFGTAAGNEQLQCAVRPVGTFNISPGAVGVVELRQDMSTLGQGSGAAAADPGLGFNIPSLIGIQVAAPLYHAGNARTIEESLSAIFVGHHQSAVATIFNPDATQIKQLTAYLLSIDEDEPAVTVPAKGATGGVLCSLMP